MKLIKKALFEWLPHPMGFVKLNFDGCLQQPRAAKDWSLLMDHFGTAVRAFAKSASQSFSH